jgi:hypothetical protein
MTGYCTEAWSRMAQSPEARELWTVITTKLSIIFGCSNVTASRTTTHCFKRHRAAWTTKHSLGVYYRPPESSRCCNSLTHIQYNKTPIYSAWWVITRASNLSPPSPDRGSSFAPSKSNIHDTFSIGTRPGYNKTTQTKRTANKIAVWDFTFSHGITQD